MNILLLYPKYPETFWNPTGSIQTLLKRQAMMPPLGLLTIAAYLPDDFDLRLVDRTLGEESAADWEWVTVPDSASSSAMNPRWPQRVIAPSPVSARPAAPVPTPP